MACRSVSGVDEDVRDPPTHPHPWYIAIIVHQAPLMTDQVKLQNMIIDLVGILVKAAERVDLVVSAIRDRGID